MPPLSPQAFTDNNADVASYSPIGRLIYASAGIKF
jgi:iron complex outermembrane receptor protein